MRFTEDLAVHNTYSESVSVILKATLTVAVNHTFSKVLWCGSKSCSSI